MEIYYKFWGVLYRFNKDHIWKISIRQKSNFSNLFTNYFLNCILGKHNLFNIRNQHQINKQF